MQFFGDAVGSITDGDTRIRARGVSHEVRMTLCMLHITPHEYGMQNMYVSQLLLHESLVGKMSV